MMSLIKDGKGQSLSETHKPMFWVTSGATRLCRLHSLCHAAVEVASRMHMFTSVFVDLKMACPRRCLPFCITSRDKSTALAYSDFLTHDFARVERGHGCLRCA